MKGYRTFVAATIAVMLALPGLAQAQQKMRIAGNFPLDHSSTLAMKKFAEDVKVATNGEIEIDVFPAMQLGGPEENVDQVLSGTIFLTWLGTGYLTKIEPTLEAVNIPFLFSDRDIAFQVIDGEVGERFASSLEQHNLKKLGFMELGFRNVTNNVKPLKSIDDFQGMKLRTVPSNTHLATFNALGANPTPMDWKEVYSALQQGVIDGQENPWAIIRDARLFEVQKYLSNTRHLYDFIIIVANKQAYERLPEEHRHAIDTAIEAAVANQRAAAREADEQALKDLQELGMQYDPLPAEELRKIRDAVASVAEQVRQSAGGDIIDLIQTETQRLEN
jgi:TRAP-type transport system periplasmic protein